MTRMEFIHVPYSQRFLTIRVIRMNSGGLVSHLHE